MIGKTILHYKILEKLGEGGMGVVYLAEDTKLERKVAIKFLPRHVAANEEEKQRFVIEAKAAAALNHSNIATIHNIEEADNEIFIVMEYIQGQELKDIIRARRAVPLPVDDVISYATQIGEGLQAAHKKGIVHRDIKSANIMVTEEGKVKIMDFGLAKVRGGAQVTKVGTTIGTAAYMSPEQARGEEADHRSDIWSFGVVLHEMLTGQFPFGGDYDQAVIYAILNEQPHYSDELPENCKPILEKALEKDPDKRYQQIEELLSDLTLIAKGEELVGKRSGPKGKRSLKQSYPYAGIAIVAVVIAAVTFFWPFGVDTQTIDSIAVLPLENLSGDPSQEYFADGMTEALIMDLSKIRNLKVISRTSVMQYKDIKKPLPQIADELGVKAVIEGSVIREGDQVRISAQLIEAATDKHLWAESYDRNMTNILSLQREIALAIASQIKVVLSPEEEKSLKAAEVIDPKAHESYLKGLHHLRKDIESDYLKSISYFNDATKVTPTYALAYVGIADAYQRMASSGYMATADGYPKAIAAVNRALELEPELNEAHLALARIKFVLEWDWEGAEREFLKVLEQNPSSAKGHERYAIYLTMMGRFDESLRHILLARELDPLSEWINNNVGWIYFLQRKYAQSLDQYKKTLEMYPDFNMSHREISAVYAVTGKSKLAIESAETAVKLSNNDPYALSYLGMIYAMVGEHGKAEAINQQMIERSKTKAIPLYELAMTYHLLGNNDMAFQYLEQTYKEKSGWAFIIKVDPMADKLRLDPRYEPFVRKMGLEP